MPAKSIDDSHDESDGTPEGKSLENSAGEEANYDDTELHSLAEGNAKNAEIGDGNADGDDEEENSELREGYEKKKKSNLVYVPVPLKNKKNKGIHVCVNIIIILFYHTVIFHQHVNIITDYRKNLNSMT